MKHLYPFERRFLVGALLIHIVAAWFSLGHHHPDEHHQIIEFASYKLGQAPVSVLPWEFTAQMRPGLQPFMTYVLLKAYYATGASNPYHFTFLLRLLSSLFALWTAVRFHIAIRESIRSIPLRKVHFVLSVLGWGLVYLHVRFSSENWSALFFTFAVIALSGQHRHRFWWFGIFAGLSFLFRFQSGFFVAGAGLWMLFIDRTRLRDILLSLLGFGLMFGLGILADHWLYGTWTLSSWAYLDQNIFQHKAAQFGLEPWHWYFGQIFQLCIPPFSLVLLLGLAAMVLYRPRHVLTWSVLLFLIAHSMVGHKEFRFLFPAAFFVPYIVITALEYLEQRFPGWDRKKGFRIWSRVFAVAFWVTNTAALFLMIGKPASDTVALNKYLYDHVSRPTILIYSTPHSPCLSDHKKADFYDNDLITSYCIDEIMDDTVLLKDKQVLLYSEHAFRKDEFLFQFAPPFFDSSRTSPFYSNLPHWLYRYNYNNWIERSNCYSLYLLHTR